MKNYKSLIAYLGQSRPKSATLQWLEYDFPKNVPYILPDYSAEMLNKYSMGIHKKSMTTDRGTRKFYINKNTGMILADLLHDGIFDDDAKAERVLGYLNNLDLGKVFGSGKYLHVDIDDIK